MATIPKFEETEQLSEIPSFDDTVEMADVPAFEDTVDLDKPETQPSEVSVQPKKVDRLRRLKAGLAGAGAGATLGWLDEAMAAADATLDIAVDSIMRRFTPEETAKWIDKPEFKKAYAESRDNIRKELNTLQEEFPEAYTGGEIGGALATIALPGGALAKAAGRLGNVVKASKAGQAAARAVPATAQRVTKAAALPTTTGAVAGAGLSESDENLMADTLTGAATGALLVGAGPAVKKAAQKLAKKADIAQLSKIGFDAKDFEKLPEADKRTVARFARDAKILTSSPEKTFKNAQAVKDAAVRQIQDVHGKLSGAQVQYIDKQKVADQISKEIKEKYVRPTRPEAGQYLEGMLQELEQLDPSDFKAVHKFRQDRGLDLSDPQMSRLHRDMAKKAFAVYAEAMGEAIEAAGEKIKDPRLLQEFKNANKQFQFADKIDRAARKAHSRAQAMRQTSALNQALELGRRTLSPSNIALATVNPQLVPAKMVLEAAKQKYGTTTGAKIQRLAEQGEPLAVRVRDMLSKAPVTKSQTQAASTVGVLDLLRGDE